MGYEVVAIPQNPCYDKPISAHPDIFMTKINDNIFVDGAVHSMFINFQKISCVGRGQAQTGKYKYPEDVYLNCAQVGGYLICNEKFTCTDVIQFALNSGIKIVDVKQGYAKCSVCVVSDNAIITEDAGIAETVSKNTDIDVLMIEKGHVGLSGYDYGFFGGCGGLIENNLLAFNGNIENHPDYDKISSFCKKHGVETVSLSDEGLYDIGTIIRIV